ncbi:MAG: formate dehydrogenase subunit delta [Sphingomonadaceae bacterium]|jgi:formate dehydrogenase subunit delta
MNTLDRLVYMANQIAHNMNAMADADDVIAMVADHIHQFWDPRMMNMIMTHVASGGEGLEPVALAALQRLAAQLKPTAAADTAAG